MKTVEQASRQAFAATSNACTVCAPLGACVAFKGIADAMPLLHGSQGCSTYIRRYLIGHFREPVDIASSSFSEETTVFGGGENLRRSIINIVKQYSPSLIGIATTCLAETIGEDVALHLRGMEIAGTPLPPIVHVKTPSYNGSPAEGFRRAVYAVVGKFAKPGAAEERIALLPAMVSPADLRQLRDIVERFGCACTMLPDYSDTLDGGIWESYRPLPEGGTTIDEITTLGACAASIELGASAEIVSAGELLKHNCGVPPLRMGLPIGIDACDQFFSMLSGITEQNVPQRHAAERRRLVDAYVDGHKFVAGKRVIVFGDEDFAPAIAMFVAETGLRVAAVASAASEKTLRAAFNGTPGMLETPLMLGDADFDDIAAAAADLKPDLLVGGGKGYTIARKLGIPLVRAGFPVHDRFGAQRLLHVGYEGTLALYDRIVNALIEHNQAGSDIGYQCW